MCELAFFWAARQLIAVTFVKRFCTLAFVVPLTIKSGVVFLFPCTREYLYDDPPFCMHVCPTRFHFVAGPGVGYPRGQVRADLPGARVGHQLGHVLPRRQGAVWCAAGILVLYGMCLCSSVGIPAKLCDSFGILVMFGIPCFLQGWYNSSSGGAGRCSTSP